MIIYSGTKKDFINKSVDHKLPDIVKDTIWKKMHKRISPSEYNSYKETCREMSNQLFSSPDIPEDCGVALEYNLPYSSMRIDFILSGLDAEDRSNVLIIELKQWQEAHLLSGYDGVIEASSRNLETKHLETYTGGANRKVTHPSYQAMAYASFLREYNKAVYQKNIRIHSCSYLFNYQRKKKEPLEDKSFAEYLQDSPLFLAEDAGKLRSFWSTLIKKSDGNKTLSLIDKGDLKPSKKLSEEMGKILRGNPTFTLLDEQKVIYETILNYAREGIKRQRKQVIIVKGGPGTGKSVIAVRALAELNAEGMSCVYTTKTKAPRDVYSKMLRGEHFKKGEIDHLFKGASSFGLSEANKYDVIITDEAHRLVKDRYSHTKQPQFFEIINAAKTTVFFIDEAQTVSYEDACTISDIKRCAAYFNAEVKEDEETVLSSQFRCNGSDGYLSWLDDVLQIRDTANFSLEGIDYDFRVMDTIEDLQKAIFRKNEENHASRIMAGYCWDWISKGDMSKPCDIVIGEHFAMHWNNMKAIWALEPQTINEVGCIHTSQGLEFDYVGVIIGEDLRYENGSVLTDVSKRSKKDKTIQGYKTHHKKNPKEAEKKVEAIIRNTYRTLMSRGMKGCYVYCLDKALNG